MAHREVAVEWRDYHGQESLFVTATTCIIPLALPNHALLLKLPQHVSKSVVGRLLYSRRFPKKRIHFQNMREHSLQLRHRSGLAV